MSPLLAALCRTVGAVLVAWVLGAAAAPARVAAAETVDIVVPGSVVFFVGPGTTVGSPNPAVVRFDTARLALGKKLVVKVRPASTTFSDGSLLATSVSFTTANAVNGVGSSGTLTPLLATTVYTSVINPGAGSVEVTWRITPAYLGLPTGGTKTLDVVWVLTSE